MRVIHHHNILPTHPYVYYYPSMHPSNPSIYFLSFLITSITHPLICLLSSIHPSTKLYIHIYPFICLLLSMHLIRRFYFPWTVCLDSIKPWSLHLSTCQVTTYIHNQTPNSSFCCKSMHHCNYCRLFTHHSKNLCKFTKHLLFWAKCATMSAFALSVCVCCLFKCASLVCFMDSATVNILHAIHVLRCPVVDRSKLIYQGREWGPWKGEIKLKRVLKTNICLCVWLCLTISRWLMPRNYPLPPTVKLCINAVTL